MPESKGSKEKHYLSDMYLTNEAVKLIPNNEKLNNVIQSEAPLLEKKINIDDNDLYEVKQPKLRKLHKSRLFVALICTACALIITGTIIISLYLSKGMRFPGSRSLPICPVGEGYPLQEIQFPYIPDDERMHNNPRLSENQLFNRRTTENTNSIPDYPFFSSINSMPGPVIIKTEEIESETKTDMNRFTTENPLIERNLDEECEDGMTSYSIGPDIKICAIHKEVKVEDMGFAVEDCKDIKGHLPQVGNPEELRYIGGLLKDMSSMTRMRHLSPILVKREAKDEDIDGKDMSKGWSFYQAMNQSKDMDGADPNNVGILCIRPLDQKDLGFFWKVEADMINMMKNVRDRVSSMFSSSRRFFGNQ